MSRLDEGEPKKNSKNHIPEKIFEKIDSLEKENRILFEKNIILTLEN